MGGKRITEEQKERIRNYRKQGFGYTDIARVVGVSTTAARTYSLDVEQRDIDINNDKFATIDGYDGRYVVSNDGRVFSVPKYSHVLKELATFRSKSGLNKVSLATGKTTKMYFIDELVANAFVKRDSDDDVYVCHIDGDKSNDSYDNLTWVSEPQGGKSRHLKEPGERKPKKSLSADECEDVRARWAKGEDTKALAEEYEVSYATVWTAIRGLTRDVMLPESEPGEEWLPVEGFAEGYFISSHGRLFSTGCGRGALRLIKQCPDCMGYLRVSIVDDGGHSRTVGVHRLVAKAFCDGWSPIKCCVNHIDGNVTNNCASNLEWTTIDENNRHAREVLGKVNAGNDQTLVRTERVLPVDPSSKPSPFRVFTDEQVIAIRNDSRSANKIAKEYGVNKCTIVRIRKGITYKNV